MDHYLSLLKLNMGRYPAVDVVVTLDILLEVCKHYDEKGEAIAYIAGSKVNTGAELDESNAIYISDMREDDTTLSILLVRGDPERAIPAFVNPQTRKVTVIESDEPGNVPGASAHLIISKQEIAAGPDQGRHRMALEKTRGIGRALVRDFLGNLLTRFAHDFPDRFVAEKKRKSKNEKPEMLSYRPTVRFNPQPNASLKDDLENGRIGGFKLVRGTTDFQGEASEPKVEKIDVQLRAVIAPTKDMGKVTQLIKGVQAALESVAFHDFKLELVDEGGEPLRNTEMLSVESLEAEGDMRYCRTIPIAGLVGEVSECYSEFHAPVLAFAKKAIAEPGYWN
jgi:hypothetical protein